LHKLIAGTSGAGADTTGAALQVFILAMCEYPQVQEKAQRRIDEFVPRGRLPSFDDLDNLSYIRALVKEVLRWRIINPLSVPHRLAENDHYMGYFLPKGATLLANLYEISRDPNVYPEPDVFRPERFMDREEKEEIGCPASLTKEGIHTHGHGRRICAGSNIANNSLFIMFATVLWALKIEKKQLGIVDYRSFVDEGLLARCPDFPCKFTWRDSKAEELVLNGLG